MAKPDRKIFQQALSEYTLDPAQTVFIDDHHANIESARSLGLTAAEYDGSELCLERIRDLARES